MSVTNYTPSADSGCSYNYSKLKDVVYLVSEDAVKDVHIDDGEAYIDGLSELPLRINGFNIQFTETESLDERYRFTKTLTLSMHGYVNVNFFGGRFYAIIETSDGTYYMINVDFPSRITHTFNLSYNTNQTDFTFSSQSNMPTLKLASEFEAVEPVCLGYNVHGIESLELIEKNYVAMSKDNGSVTVDTYSGKEFCKVKYLGNSCSLQEVFDGEKVTDTITFDIGFDNYKTSWHYNLLEFLDNIYAARIITKGADNEFFVGFGFGLSPSYEIQSTTNNGESDKITVTLRDVTNYGMTAANDSSERQSTLTKWRYIKWVDGIKCFECVDIGTARYLVQQEIDGLGNPTGDYKAMQDYEQYYTNKGLNIVGTFTTEQEFNSEECEESDGCELGTNTPSTIYYNAVTCNTYSLESTCDWNVTNLPSHIIFEPSNGVANNAYTVVVCNTMTPTSSMVEDTFQIHYGNNVRTINVKVQTDSGFLTPTRQYINCTQQNVTFRFNSSCPISIISIDSTLTYTMGNGILTVSVPKNESIDTEKVYPIIAEDCEGIRTTVFINQDHTYEKWVVVDGYICDGTNSYQKLQRYTGTTSSEINVQTSETKKGDLIQNDDPRCASGQTKTKWEFAGNYTCVDNDKYKVEEEFISYDGGTTWTKTGQTRLGQMTESASTWCISGSVTYSWVLTDKIQCGDDEEQVDTRWVTIEGEYTCDDFDKVTKEKKQQSINGGAWTDVYEDGHLVTRAGSTVIEHNSTDCGYSPYKFMGHDSRGNSYSAECATSSTLTTGDTHVHTPLSDIVSAEIGTCVTEIGAYAMQDFEYLTAITIPSTVTKIDFSGFEQDQRLKTINLTNITSIGGYAFFNCRDLNHIRLNRNATIGEAAFDNCMSLEEINIPTTYNYSKIEYYTFRHCSGLTEVDIPANISGIGDEAFYGCTKLQSIIVRATTPPTLGFHSLTNTNDCPIFVPDREIDMYKSRWTDYRDRIKGLSEYDDWIEYLETLTAEFSAATSLNFDGTANDKMVGTYEILWKRTVHTPSTDLVAEYISDFTCELIDGDEIEYSTSMRTYNESQHIVGDDTNHVGTLALYLYRNDSGSAKTATFNIYANFYSDYTKTTRFFKKTIGTIEITQQSV